PTFSHEPDRLCQLEHSGVRERVMDEEPLTSRLDETGLLQGLQVLRGVCRRQTDFGGKGLDGSFTLRQKLDDLEPGGARQSLANARVQPVEAFLERPRICHRQVINILLEYYCQQHFCRASRRLVPRRRTLTGVWERRRNMRAATGLRCPRRARSKTEV